MNEIKMDLDLIQAWDQLNKINNQINLKETLLSTKLDIGAMKLKEIIVQCTFHGNDKLLNSIVFSDEVATELRELYKTQKAYEIYVLDELERMKLSTPIMCVAFLKEYKKMTFKQISKELNFSERQCKRYYYEDYKGKTPNDNSWQKECVK